MSRAAVVGAGMTKFGVHESPMQELFADAAFEALDDAGIEAGEIEALYFGNAMGGQTENETHLGPKMATHIGMAGTPVQRERCSLAGTGGNRPHIRGGHPRRRRDRPDPRVAARRCRKAGRAGSRLHDPACRRSRGTPSADRRPDNRHRLPRRVDSRTMDGGTRRAKPPLRALRRPL